MRTPMGSGPVVATGPAPPEPRAIASRRRRKLERHGSCRLQTLCTPDALWPPGSSRVEQGPGLKHHDQPQIHPPQVTGLMGVKKHQGQERSAHHIDSHQDKEQGAAPVRRWSPCGYQTRNTSAATMPATSRLTNRWIPAARLEARRRRLMLMVERSAKEERLRAPSSSGLR